MTKIRFYFDPGCPWCWNTSRWIKEVQKSEKIDVEWMTFSLLLKNGGEMNKEYVEKFTKTLEMLRIIEATKQKYNDKLSDSLYTEFGIKVHQEDDFSDLSIKSVLKKVCGLDLEYFIKVKSDESFDRAIRKSMNSAFDVVGRDVGIPIIVFAGEQKDMGYFGPVLSQVPTNKDAIKVWQGVSSLAQYDHFFELKRTRDEGATPPKKVDDSSGASIC